MALNGIDIASYQSSIQLENVSYDFVAIKATQGTGYVNLYCDGEFQKAKAAGKKIAVYHYADGGDAVAEANFFVDQCAGYIRQAIFVLDWEGTGVEYTAWALAFLKRVEERIGYKPAIYMSEYVVNSYDWSAIAANDNGLWVAKYSDYEIDNNYDMSGAGTMPDVKWWAAYFMWQWTSKGHLNGYAGDLDCDIAYVTPEQWDAYAGVTSATGPVPPPAPAAPEVPAAAEQPAPAPDEVPVTQIPTPSIPAPVIPIDGITPPVAGPQIPTSSPLDNTKKGNIFMSLLQFIGYARKFAIAFLAALAVLAIALTPASDGGSAITPSEWLQVALALAGAAGVYGVKNTPAAQ